ncbi:hypothetical protein [Tengunoibacter tsumagoiensis]|uniref:Uncharacterized protein n=1 Tax=Tengunoibacter tsumagoiensis TaxID=2014871 RepID=A0A402A888_9CHLR|nr:hypothetical protein [Tengunoibacter tsumagoiensis]GCE15319.1 hypothetical protein KTT_51780 [Tengunoibacter tsumagoiensis]
MANAKTFQRRVGFHWTCVAPATILPDLCFSMGEDGSEVMPSLREEMSREGLCFLRVLGIASDGLYLTHVSPSPYSIQTDYTTVFLSEEDLWMAYPWDCRFQRSGVTPAKIVSFLQAHAQNVRPFQPNTLSQRAERTFFPEESLTALESLILPIDALPELQNIEDESLIPSVEDVKEDLPSHQRVYHNLVHRHIASPTGQQILLMAVVDALMSQLYGMVDQRQALLLQQRCVLVEQVRHWHLLTHQCVVHALFSSGGMNEPCWHVTVGVPSRFLTAA